MFLRTLVFSLFSISCVAVEMLEFTSDTYPNPKTEEGARECNMRAVSNVCDPDQVLSESSRYKFNHELQQMARRTERVSGSFCDRQGFKPLLLIAHEGTQELADSINEIWNLDGHCRKSVIFFLSTLDHQFYYSTEPETGFDQSDFIAIKISQENFLAEGNYTFALTNIFKQIGGPQNIQIADEDKETDYKNQFTAVSGVQGISLNIFVNGVVALNILTSLVIF